MGSLERDHQGRDEHGTRSIDVVVHHVLSVRHDGAASGVDEVVEVVIDMGAVQLDAPLTVVDGGRGVVAWLLCIYGFEWDRRFWARCGAVAGSWGLCGYGVGNVLRCKRGR